MKVNTLTATGKQGSTTVSDAVFGVTPNQTLIAQAVRVYRANERQGTSSVQTRSDVARTKRKWYRQKGTGNARHGARSAHIFVGGGVAHGPKVNQNWSLKLTRSMKKAAMRSMLSAQAENMIIADGIEKLSGKTKEAAELLKNAQATDKKALIIVDQISDVINRSLRNIPSALLVTAAQVSPLEVAMADVIVTTSKAIKELEERLTPAAKKSASSSKAATAKTETAGKSEKKVAKPKKKAAPKKSAKSSSTKTKAKKSTTKKSTQKTSKK